MNVSNSNCYADAIRSGDGEFAAAAMRAHLSMVARAIELRLPEVGSER